MLFKYKRADALTLYLHVKSESKVKELLLEHVDFRFDIQNGIYYYIGRIERYHRN